MENEAITCACGTIVERVPGDDLLAAVERHIHESHAEPAAVTVEEKS